VFSFFLQDYSKQSGAIVTAVRLSYEGLAIKSISYCLFPRYFFCPLFVIFRRFTEEKFISLLNPLYSRKLPVEREKNWRKRLGVCQKHVFLGRRLKQEEKLNYLSIIRLRGKEDWYLGYGR